MSVFDEAFSLLIGNEGKYSNNPLDPGGETMFGITKRVARANGYNGAMKDLPISEAKRIAKRSYWDVCKCDSLPPNVAFQVFDTQYNGGFPIKWLQLAAGVKADGKLKDSDLEVINKLDQSIVVAKFNAYRIMYYTSLKGFKTFGAGWANRIAHNLLQIDKIKGE